MLRRLLCYFGCHKRSIGRVIKGRDFGKDVICLVVCCRCNHRWVYSDPHQAYLRYDDDPRMIEDLRFLYGDPIL